MFSLIQLFILILIPWLSLIKSDDDIGKLPDCLENFTPGLALVSTIDGKLSAINADGILSWQVETGPGPLLVSNIHNLELTNSGKWIRIIPSLTGTLYKFDGLTIDPISISAESLLKSSFKYTDDLVIAGGLEVQTYGIGFRTGKLYYKCSAEKCTNTTDNESEVDDILLLERSTQTVRAIEPQSGHERWNFSVGHHNIKLPQISCINRNANLFNWNLTAIIPEGLLLASSLRDNVELGWQYRFPSPIVKIWKWNGHKLTEVDLFTLKGKSTDLREMTPSIYIGMHKKQLYIHESKQLLERHSKIYHTQNQVIESVSLQKIPWRPVSASGRVTEDDSTAISVLYSSEYVNGNGYYLYGETDNGNSDALCEKNTTRELPFLHNYSDNFGLFYTFFSWWKEILITAIFSIMLFHLLFGTFARKEQNQKVIFVERHIEVPVLDRSNSTRLSESSDNGGAFNSRFLNDFDTLHCLGKGGFGIVFEVKQKIDECHYAIKRIVLPNEQNKRKAVMREVKALAKLEHQNIVRYFNSWMEEPPYGWQHHHDMKWINNDSTITESVNNPQVQSLENSVLSNSMDFENNDVTNTKDDSFIVFADTQVEYDKENNTNSINSENTTTKSDLSTYNGSASKTDSPNKINWKRPGRRYQSLNGFTNPPVYLYIQMQLCQKKSLKGWLVDNKVRNLPTVLEIFKQILSAVEYVHLQGLIHRDLKPSNIFFSMDGKIKVGDFGLVKDCEDSHEHSYSNTPIKGHTKEVGTRLYMSPEQLNGKQYNYKVDIYSLGLIFYELLVYFSTDMERIDILTRIRDNIYPVEFIDKYPEEYKLLKMMLCQLPEKRLTTLGIRARPPINWIDDYDVAYDFELPKSKKNIYPTCDTS